MHGCFLKQRKAKKVKGRAEGYLLKMKQIHCKAYMEIHVFTLGPLRLRAWIQSQTQQQEVLIVESSLRGDCIKLWVYNFKYNFRMYIRMLSRLKLSAKATISTEESVYSF